VNVHVANKNKKLNWPDQLDAEIMSAFAFVELAGQA
jgi:hypothetical protein